MYRHNSTSNILSVVDTICTCTHTSSTTTIVMLSLHTSADTQDNNNKVYKIFCLCEHRPDQHQNEISDNKELNVMCVHLCSVQPPTVVSFHNITCAYCFHSNRMC